MCGSGQQAVNFAAGQIRGGLQDVVVAGGIEQMTRVPMGSDNPMQNANLDGQALAMSYFEEFSEVTTQGEGAERIAEQWGLSREDVDRIAADSQQRWGEASEAGMYDEQVVPVETERDGEELVVEEDEHPRPETDMETLGTLPLVFRSEGDGVVHPGNASGIVDGAAGVLVASGEACDRFGWDPIARIVDQQVVGVDPLTMLTGPIPATQELLGDDRLGYRPVRGERGVRAGRQRVARGDRRRLGPRQRLGRRYRPRPPPRGDRRGAGR